MEQKIVSLKVAKAIKKARYPQDISTNDHYYTEDGQLSNLYYWGVPYYAVYCFAPTYLDVWLWLWREKSLTKTDVWENYINDISNNYIDPEEAIITAIEYLVDNDLIK